MKIVTWYGDLGMVQQRGESATRANKILTPLKVSAHKLDQSNGGEVENKYVSKDFHITFFLRSQGRVKKWVTVTGKEENVLFKLAKPPVQSEEPGTALGN
jgi:hypothetical protein